MTDRLVSGMGEKIRKYVEGALEACRVEVHTRTRVAHVSERTLTLEHDGVETEIETSGVVWVAGVRVNPLIDELPVEKDARGLIAVEPTLQVRRHGNVFALGDNSFLADVVPTLAG